MAELTYFKKFNTKSEYDTYIDGTPVLPNVSIVANEDVYFTDGDAPEPTHDYSQDYLTFIVLENNTTIDTEVDGIEFSTDDGSTWVGEGVHNLAIGTKVLARGNVKSGGESTSLVHITGSVSLEGNIMSIYDSTGFRTRTSFDGEKDNLYWLFYGLTGLTSAENLILPVTTLTSSCYYGMFNSCTNLTSAPALPATTLADYCYSYMFAGCTGLTSAPELPATTLAGNCYQNMFQGCESLATAPVLPATTLAQGCYYQMFLGCTSLTSAPELPATTLAQGCYSSMFYDCSNLNYIKCLATNISASDCTYDWVNGVSSTGTFVKNANMSSWTTGGDGIPNNWSVQDA